MSLELSCISNHFCANQEKLISAPPWSAHLPERGLTKLGLKSVFLDLRKKGWRYSLALKTSFLALYVSYLNPELELCRCKMAFMGCQRLNLRWPSRAQFFKDTLESFKINATFQALQVLFQSFFDIS